MKSIQNYISFLCMQKGDLLLRCKQVVTTMLASVLVCTGCGNTTAKKPENVPKEKVLLVYPKKEKPATTLIRYGGTSAEKGMYEKYIQQFNRIYPEIEVQFVEMPSEKSKYYQQLSAVFDTQSDKIDVFTADMQWLSAFEENESILPLTDFIERDGFDLSAFLPPTVISAQVQGQTMAIPKSISVDLLYMRNDVTEEIPTTWPQIQNIIEAYEDSFRYGMVFAARSVDDVVSLGAQVIGSVHGIELQGEKFIFSNQNALLSGLKQFQQLFLKGKTPAQLMTLSEEGAIASFAQGDSVFLKSSQAAWEQLNQEDVPVFHRFFVTALPLVSINGEQGRQWVTQEGYVINAYTKEKEAAWKWIAFLSEEETQKEMALENQKIPVRTSLLKDKEILRKKGYLASEAFISTLENSILPMQTPTYKAQYDAFGEMLLVLLSGEKSVSEIGELLMNHTTQSEDFYKTKNS